MFNQKGQIQVIFLVLLVVGFILYINFSDKSFLRFILPSSSTKSTPVNGRTSAQTPPPPKQEEAPITPAEQTSPPSGPVAPDTTPPNRFNVQPTGILPPETRKTALSLETNENAICRYSSISGVFYNSMQGKFDQTDGTSHSVLITTLSEGEKYKYYIKCSDEQGNANIDDFVVSFEVKLPEDKTPPVLANPSHQDSILPTGTGEAIIIISTNEPASCRYSANSGTPYSSMPGSFSYYDETKKFHVKTITGLADGKAYDFFVRCRDMAGNINTGDVLINFKVAMP